MYADTYMKTNAATFRKRVRSRHFKPFDLPTKPVNSKYCPACNTRIPKSDECPFCHQPIMKSRK